MNISSSSSLDPATSPSAAKIATDEAMLMTYIKQLEQLEKSKEQLLRSRESRELNPAYSAQHSTPASVTPVASESTQTVAEKQEVIHSMPAELEQLAQKAREEVSSLRVRGAGVPTGHEKKGWSHWFWDSG